MEYICKMEYWNRNVSEHAWRTILSINKRRAKLFEQISKNVKHTYGKYSYEVFVSL